MTFPPFHGFSRRVPRREREKARMRNSKINPIHDVVRKVAVAPKPRQCYRKPTSKHADASLSESDSDEYPKIRSYIKPNKNINTLARAMREERMMQTADRSFSTISKKLPHKPRSYHVVSADRIPHCRPSVSTVGKAASPPPPTPRMSHELTATVLNADEKRKPFVAKVPAGAGSTSRYCKESSFSDVASASSDRVAKHRNMPIPPPVPRKRSRNLSPVCSASSQSQKRDPTRSSPNRPNMLCNENSNVLPSNHSGIFKQISTTYKDQLKANTQQRSGGTDFGSSMKCSNRKECSPARKSAAPEANIVWNEAANLANLHKLRIKIFTLDTLPEKDKWYLDEFSKVSVGEGCPAKKRNSLESRASSAHEESRPSSCSAHRVEASPNSFSGFGSRSNRHYEEKVERDLAHPMVSLSQEALRKDDCGTFHRSVASTSLNSLQRHISTLRSCLTQSVKSPKKKVDFSENLVTTFFHGDRNRMSSQVPPVAEEVIAVQCHDNPERRCQVDLHLQGSAQQFSMKQVKIEEEDDEVQILFSGRPEYLEALHRERCRE